jgi:hypothetical protein
MFIDPTNVNYSQLNGQMYLADPRSNPSKYMPQYWNESGTNLFLKQKSKMYFTLWGNGDYIDLKIAPFLYVKFGFQSTSATTVDAFFNSATLVLNFADLLRILPDKIRYVNIIRETTASGRKKRQTTSFFIELDLFENPVQYLSDQALLDTASNFIPSLEANVTNRYTTGELENGALDKLNVTFLCRSRLRQLKHLYKLEN